VNFIAHIHLSGDDEALMVGNYIADLIRQKDMVSLPPDILNGVMLHRFIDTYTDAHIINKNTLDLLYERHRKYAPVLLDIYYDFFLIRHWNMFSVREFRNVCDQTYLSLSRRLEEIPLTAQANIKNLLQKRWLTSAYGSIAGLEKTFYFLRQRMSKPEYIQGATQTLIDLDAELNEAFLSFYPQLISTVDDYMTEINLDRY
jgi:acyl carrier protein phosphodiesterase